MSIILKISKSLILFYLVIAITIGSMAQDDILPETTRSCKVDSLMLDAGWGFDTYLWNTGEVTQQIWVETSGLYKVQVTGDTIDIKDSTNVIILDVEIVQSDTTILCGDTILLSGSSSAFDYTWSPVNEFGDSILVYPRDTTMYYAEINDTVNTSDYCVDSVLITVDPRVFIDTIFQYRMACKDSSAARVEFAVSGGDSPYLIECFNVDKDPPSKEGTVLDVVQNVVNLKDGNKLLIATDTIGCLAERNFVVEAYPLPEIEIYTNLESDTIYLQNPIVAFSFENITYDSTLSDTFELQRFAWDFGDSTKFSILYSPTHAYAKTGDFNVVFDFTTLYGCPGDDSISITVKPVDLRVTTVLTPDGNGLNDLFEVFEKTADQGGGNGGGAKSTFGSSDEPIDLSKYYLSNTLVVFNRWGQKVFETDNYQNNWDGGGLNDGVYFFVLKCVGQYENAVFKGSVTIFNP